MEEAAAWQVVRKRGSLRLTPSAYMPSNRESLTEFRREQSALPTIYGTELPLADCTVSGEGKQSVERCSVGIIRADNKKS